MKKLKPSTKRYAVLAVLAFGMVGVLGAASQPTAQETAAAATSQQSEARLVAALSCTSADEARCR